MTLLVGILCKDGVVIASDSEVTFGVAPGRYTIGQHPTKSKIMLVNPTLIIAGTGQVGLDQRFKQIAGLAWDGKTPPGTTIQPLALGHAKTSPIDVGVLLSQVGRYNFGSTGAPVGEYGALVGFVLHNRAHLCELQARDFQPELKTEDIWYVASGSGQTIADPFLALMRRIFWADGMPSLKSGIFVATWALQHVIQTNPGGVGGDICIGVIGPDMANNGKMTARMLTGKELDEPRARVDAAMRKLRQFVEEEPADGEVAIIPEPEQPATK